MASSSSKLALYSANCLEKEDASSSWQEESHVENFIREREIVVIPHAMLLIFFLFPFHGLTGGSNSWLFLLDH